MLNQDPKAHAEGYHAGQKRKPSEACPYPPESAKAWAWSAGYIEGKATPDKPYPAFKKAAS